VGARKFIPKEPGEPREETEQSYEEKLDAMTRKIEEQKDAVDAANHWLHVLEEEKERFIKKQGEK